jgi:hypothetical protein
MSIQFRRRKECSAWVDCVSFFGFSSNRLLGTVRSNRNVIVCGEGIDLLESSLVWQKDGEDSAAEGIGGAGADAQGAAVLLYQFA